MEITIKYELSTYDTTYYLIAIERDIKLIHFDEHLNKLKDKRVISLDSEECKKFIESFE